MIPSSSLSNLGRVAGGDSRSAINTLQFEAAGHALVDKRNVLNSGDSQKYSYTFPCTGTKDEIANPFEFWKNVFRRRSPDKKIDFLYSTPSDSTILVEGFFENYPKVKSTDSSMATMSKVCEWLSFANSAHNMDKHHNTSVVAVSLLCEVHDMCPCVTYALPFFLFASNSS